MKEITILSGKGGTGKTTIAAALASVAKNAVYCDNDVDAADLHLLFNPTIQEKYDFSSGWAVSIDSEKCNACSLCLQHCRFDAIHQHDNGEIYINSLQCEGCRLCERVCPNDAISSIENTNNHWFISTSRFGTLVHAEMGPGEENSGKLVSQVRKKAKEIGLASNLNFILNDGPPGIGCATIASISGTNRVLLVIEPTKSGLHDAIRLIELINSFNIETYAIINKFDINEEVVEEIKTFLNDNNIPLLAQIPFDEKMVEAMTLGQTIVEYQPESEITEIIKTVWKRLIN
ncbi:P-loop NTPase [Carboxylicivirga caseinilyticus]|uniref:ATP-binding protein n=1 Tax=Carboxylicivirga caseinilyticus TaxID=3417572 RepID=UPI0029C77E5E|nr:P-loop NTPase [uncultured Carboxylicivirga sp.]MCU4164336.1 P-loop NTPase [Marinilabiliaceae bacterium A049]